MFSLASCRSLGADAAGRQATTHGTLPWTASHERRAVLARFCPASMAYMGPGGSGYGDSYRWGDDVLAGLNDEQRAVLEPPYHVRLRRPIIDDDGTLLTDEEAKVLHSFDWLKVRHARGRL